MSEYFISGLNDIKMRYPNIIKEVRGIGLLIGLQLFKDQTEFINKLMESLLIILVVVLLILNIGIIQTMMRQK